MKLHIKNNFLPNNLLVRTMCLPSELPPLALENAVIRYTIG